MMEPEEGDNGREKDKGEERGKPVKKKSFPLTNLALNNRTTILLATLMIALFGIESYVTLPKDSFPEISINKIYIGTPYPGNSPVDIENLITRPIEKELNTISEIDEINSVTVQDYATIIVDFPPEMDIQEALTKVKDAVDKVKSELPTDLEQDPNVFEFDFGQMPILNINLSGDYDVEQLERYAEELKEDVERLSEVAKVEIRGVDEKEVEVLVDPYKMDATKVSFGDIEQAVASENMTMSGGDVMEGGLRRSVRIIGEIKDPQQLEYIVVRSEKGDVVHLRDVATVRFGYRSEKNTYARLSQKPVVSVDITKRSGQNLLLATDKIYRIIDRVSKRLPQDLSMSITNDQSDYTRQMVSGLENNIIFGVLLVVLVLQFFLGTRNALFVGMAIPLSMFLSFCILALLGATINMMVLFSLIMALGMLGRQRHRGRRELLPPDGNRAEPLGSRQARGRRSGYAYHLLHDDYPRCLLPPSPLARYDGRIYALPAHHAHHHSELFSGRRIGDQSGRHLTHDGAGRENTEQEKAAPNGAVDDRLGDSFSPTERTRDR